MKIKLIKGLLTGMMAAALLTGCAGPAGGTDAAEIRIGVVAPLTGGAAVFGISSSNGTRLAFDQINEAGGILGAQINYILYDDMHSPVDSVQAFERLVHDDNVVAVVGPVTSGPATAVAQANVGTRIPMVTPTATAYGVTTPGDFIFRACFLDAQQAIAMASFARNTLGAQTAAILYDSAMDYSTGLAENFRETFANIGGDVVAWEAYIGGAVDFRAQLTTIRELSPDVLFIPDYFPVIALMAAQVAELGIEATLLGGDGWEGVFTVLDDPHLLNGSFYSSHFAAGDPSPVVQNFIQSYYALHGGPPNSFAALGFDAGKIMAQAIEAAGSTENEAIISALAALQFSGVTGDITFDAGGNPIKAVLVTGIQNGEAGLYMRVEP